MKSKFSVFSQNSRYVANKGNDPTLQQEYQVYTETKKTYLKQQQKLQLKKAR